MIVRKAKPVTGSTIRYSRLFPEIKRPPWADTIRFPADLTQLTAANVSELHGKYTELYAYANQELCRINVEILRWQTEESRARNEIFRRNPSINSQERWRRDAVLDTFSAMERLANTLSRLKTEREYVSMYLQNFDRYLIALSRELSRKTHEMGLR